MNNIEIDNGLLDTLKQKYQVNLVYDLFKKYKKINLLKKILNKHTITYKKNIDIS